MNAPNSYPEQTHKTADFAIDRWENEGRAHDHDSPDLQYGRRVESDLTWTVYHVFTGIPARIDGSAMIGLTQGGATDRMLLLNRLETRGRAGGNPIVALRTALRTAEECRQ